MKAFMRFFEKYGLLKLFASLGLLALITWLYDKTEWEFLKYVIWVPGGYLILAFIMFLVAGIVGSINEHKGIKNGSFDKRGRMLK